MNGSQDGQDTCRHMLVSHGLIVLSGINLDPAVFAVQTCVPMPAVCREPSNGKRIYKGIMMPDVRKRFKNGYLIKSLAFRRKHYTFADEQEPKI